MPRWVRRDNIFSANVIDLDLLSIFFYYSVRAAKSNQVRLEISATIGCGGGGGVQMAKNGDIKGVGVAHRGETEYLKSIPDGSESNNLGSLPTVSG